MAARRPFDPATGQFLPVDVAAQAKELRLEKRGQERGAQNQPPASAKIPDSVEQEVENRISTVARLAQSEMTAHLAMTRDRLQPLTTEDRANRVHAEARQAWTNMYENVRSTLNLLVALKRDVISAESWLTQFKAEHGLSRPANYPAGHFGDAVLIAFLFIVETIANAFLIGDAMEYGWSEGAVVMLFISFVNITVGFAVGLLLMRQLQHRRAHRKLFAVLLILPMLAVIVGWNLLVGHYRDVLVTFALDPAAAFELPRHGQIAVERFLSSEALRLDDFKSWLALLVGTLLSLIAMWKGLHWDDVYPGYGRTARDHRAKLETYGRAFEAAQKRLNDLAGQGKQSIDELLATSRAYLAEAARIVADIIRLKGSYGAYMLQLQRDAQQLLQIYRDANMASRKTESPKYWDKKFTLSQDLTTFPEFEAWPRIDLPVIDRAAQMARQRIDDEVIRFMSVYRTIDRLDANQLEGFAVEALLRSVEEQAKAAQ